MESGWRALARPPRTQRSPRCRPESRSNGAPRRSGCPATVHRAELGPVRAQGGGVDRSRSRNGLDHRRLQTSQHRNAPRAALRAMRPNLREACGAWPANPPAPAAPRAWDRSSPSRSAGRDGRGWQRQRGRSRPVCRTPPRSAASRAGLTGTVSMAESQRRSRRMRCQRPAGSPTTLPTPCWRNQLRRGPEAGLVVVLPA